MTLFEVMPFCVPDWNWGQAHLLSSELILLKFGHFFLKIQFYFVCSVRDTHLVLDKVVYKHIFLV